MSKLSFRARALDAGKPMPIYMAEELPDLPDYSAINRAVPQMPSGMEKEEECEHHLQRAICAGLIIPTPEVSEVPDRDAHDRLYPADYKQPRQLIHMQPFTMEQDIPDYDMDSDDERWLDSQTKRLELSALKFEEMMDRLEKSSGQTVVTLSEAKALLKEDDDLIIAVFDYWLNKRLKLQHPLILSVKTEHRTGTATNNPYLAFRRRTEKMQTRKNRKNDETSYEKMLKLRRDLSRAVTLLDSVKRREKTKREYVHLTVEIFEKRFQAKDFSGAIISELSAIKAPRPAFTPLFQNHYTNQNWTKGVLKDEIVPRKEKRQYKKRKHKSLGHAGRLGGLGPAGLEGLAALSSDEEPASQPSPEPEELDDEGQFAFRRNKHCSYHMPTPLGTYPTCPREETSGVPDRRHRYTLTSLAHPVRRCVGFARRRVGRGGRVILDRVGTDFDDVWRQLDYTIYDDGGRTATGDPSLGGEEKPPRGDLFAVAADDDARTSLGSVNSDSGGGGGDVVVAGRVTIKREPIGEDATTTTLDGVNSSEKAVTVVHSREDQDEMVEFLRYVRKDWLHFRPRTPPPDYELPCHLLPAEDPTFAPRAGAPFSLELRGLDDAAATTLTDCSTFVAGPFLYEELGPLDEVPVTDTRQRRRSESPPPARRTSPSAAAAVVRTIGCSWFDVSDTDDGSLDVPPPPPSGSRPQLPASSATAVSATSKLDSANVVRQRMGTAVTVGDCGGAAVTSANGIVSQFGVDVSPGIRTKLNKKLYAYSGEVGTGANALSLLTSTHTVTLNSHSANILEIPMSNDTDPVPTKIVSAQCEPTTAPANNNKNKAIVRKNNVAMEVT